MRSQQTQPSTIAWLSSLCLIGTLFIQSTGSAAGPIRELTSESQMRGDFSIYDEHFFIDISAVQSEGIETISFPIEIPLAHPTPDQALEALINYLTNAEPPSQHPLTQNPSSEIGPGITSRQVNLLRWLERPTSPAAPQMRYDRLKQFGTWVRRPGQCYNTRALVLIRDSKVSVEFNPSAPCNVLGGAWDDPYTGELIRNANPDIQIDHVVPLKHTYLAGAHTWRNSERCSYANFLANPTHLLPVSARENSSKSDNSPDEYMPPNPAYQCAYLANWLKIKAVWGLLMIPPEVQAIRQEIAENHCDPRTFRVSADEIQRLREAATQVTPGCPAD